MDELRRQFINLYQANFPVAEQPFVKVAADLGTGSDNLISLIKQLLDDGSLRGFGPMYDASSMGANQTLAAISVPLERYDEITQRVNALPEVAFNYKHEHELNMWLVITTETQAGLQQTINRIEQQVSLPVFNFPIIQTFYLGIRLIIDDNGGVTTQPVPGPLKQGGMIIDALDRCIVEATKNGLPLQIAPYTEVAAACNCDTHTVLNRMQRMLERGVIRRIGAIPDHDKLGLCSNGISLWDVADDQLLELGAQVGRLGFVSQCHERPRHLPLWPYNLFAWVHGHDRDEVMSYIDQISKLMGESCRQHEVLFSSQILNQTGPGLVA